MIYASIFTTPLGTCGMAFTAKKIWAVQLPEDNDEQVISTLQQRCNRDFELTTNPPIYVKKTIDRIQNHLDGEADALTDVPLDLSQVTPFRSVVYAQARRIRPGELLTYAQLAARCDCKNGARAIGQAMAQNPLPLLIPCHRVVGTGGNLCGFSSHGALSTKLRLLSIEGADLAFLAKAGVGHLRKKDPSLKAIIRRVGPYLLAAEQRTDPVTALAESIVHQQVSMQAGSTIFGRLKDKAGDGQRLNVDRLGRMTVESLRAIGISRQKAGYLLDLAKKTQSGSLTLSRLERMDDEVIIDKLVQIRGIGRWSAEIFLMFRLGRLDVLPVDDLGLRKAIQATYHLDSLPHASITRVLAEPWKPYRSIATWYLWRSLEAGGI